MIKKNQVSKYIIYAIGEIVLVVIGILIAVQVNSWNQVKKELKEETFYLSKLKESISFDIERFDTRITNIDSTITEILTIGKESENPELKQFTFNITNTLFRIPAITQETATWDNLKTTGKLSLIRNQSLVDSIYTYYNDFNNQSTQWLNSIKTYTREVNSEFVMNFGDLQFPDSEDVFNGYKTYSKTPLDYGRSIRFRNILRYRIGALRALKDNYIDDRERAKRIIATIDNGL